MGNAFLNAIFGKRGQIVKRRTVDDMQLPNTYFGTRRKLRESTLNISCPSDYEIDDARTPSNS
jgi:hypothetical protein